MDACTPEKDKENCVRNRLHKRGLSSRSKSSSSEDSLSSPIPAAKDPLHHLKQFLPRSQRQTLSQLTLNNSENWHPISGSTNTASEENSEGCASLENSQSYPPELHGTPSLSLRKGLLDKIHTASTKSQSQNVSPNLQRLRATPSLDKVRSAVQAQLEISQLSQSFTLQTEKESPGLTRLRQTPGKPLREKQRVLVDKHNETRQHADTLNVGGGVSLWPDMQNMRLTRRELISLTMLSVGLMSITYSVFGSIHGNTITKLETFTHAIRQFRHSHMIDLSTSETLTACSIRWHEHFINLLMEVEDSFSVAEGEHVPLTFYISSALYVCGVGTLLFYLADNVMSSSKLSPHRIKTWVCLLVVVGCWTVRMSYMFVSALSLEQAVEDNIQWLNSQQKFLIYHDLDTQKYDHILRYWTVRYLPPGQGVLSILGIIQFNSVLHYIQYYSLPIITALITPIVKLVLSVLHVYGILEQNPE